MCGLMPELYKIGNKVDSNPGYWNFLVQMLLLFHNLGMHRNYVFMAKETLFDFRQSRMLSTLDIRMAETAVDLFYPGVYPVAEIDRLDRSNVLYREKVKKVEKGEQEQNGCPEPPRPPHRFFSRRFGAFSHFLSVANDSKHYPTAHRASQGPHARCTFSSVSSAAASFGSETARTGYFCKKVQTQKAKSPSHPTVISTSNIPSGSDLVFTSEGVTSRNFSSQIPIRIQMDITVKGQVSTLFFSTAKPQREL